MKEELEKGKIKRVRGGRRCIIGGYEEGGRRTRKKKKRLSMRTKTRGKIENTEKENGRWR